MSRALPIHIAPNLTVRVGAAVVTLSPAQAMRAAEQLIRRGTRRMMIEEAEVTLDRRRPITARRRVSL
jgi:hypothetical protein